MSGAFKGRIAVCPNCKRIVEAKHLTYREWQVAKRIIAGESTAKMAKDLFVSVKTIESHINRITVVLGLEGGSRERTAQLIRWANDNNLLDLMGWNDTKEGSNMGGLEIAALIFSLVSTYGPKAKEIYDDWKKDASAEPTADEWAALKKKIDDHTPDTY